MSGSVFAIDGFRGVSGGGDMWDDEVAGPILLQDYFENSNQSSTTQTFKFWDGSAWVMKPVKWWNGSAWVVKPAKRWNGSAWV